MWTLALLCLPVAALVVQTESAEASERLPPLLLGKFSTDTDGFQVSSVTGGAQQRPFQARGEERASLPVTMGRKGRPQYSAGMTGGGQQMQQQAPAGPPADGSSIFYLYARTGPGKPWYPVSAMKGDGQSKGLINAWLNSPFAKGLFKNRLDEGMARSIYDSERRLAEMAVQQHKTLRDSKARLQWGFKILDKDVAAKEAAGDIEKQKVVLVNKEMTKNVGILNQAKDAISGFASQIGGQDDSAATKDAGIFNQAKDAMSGVAKQFGDNSGEGKIAEAALPVGWAEGRDEASGRNYYYNPSTGESTWDRPK